MDRDREQPPLAGGETTATGGTDTDHQPAWTAPWKLLEAHRAHVATALAEPGVLAVKIASFEDYVASHERRWDAIRADRKKNGWVGEGEIAFPARVKPPVRKRIYAEIARIAKVDAERS